MTNITLKDFQPINTWEPEQNGPKWDGVPVHLIDKSTGRMYWNESKEVVGFKCFLLTLGTPFVHALASVINIAERIVKLVTFSHFWRDDFNDTSLKGRVKEAGKDLLGIITAPLAVIALELSAIYGIFTPYNGRKLYASIERAQYGDHRLAPCFQPSPEKHLLGGDPALRNAF